MAVPFWRSQKVRMLKGTIYIFIKRKIFSMLKVDLIYSNYLNSPDGASRFVKTMKEQKELFAKYEIDLRVITPDLFSYKDFREGNLTQPSAIKRFVRFMSRKSAIVTKMRIKRAYKLPAYNIIDYYEQIEEKGSVVAFQEGFTAYYFLKRKEKKDQKLLLTLHNNGEIWTMLSQSMPRINSIFLKGFRKDFERTLFKGCDKIGFVADAPRRHFCTLYPFNEKQTYFCYNGVAPKPVPERNIPQTLDLVCVGSVNERKNQLGVLNAIGLLPEDYQKKISFRIVGDGTSMPILVHKAKDLTADIIFVGSCNDVDKHLQRSNCFVLFSKDEGLPISIIEGMRSGLPVIGTRIAGVPEQIIDGQTGFLVDVNEQQLAEKLRYLVDHLNEIETMGNASYDYFLEKFTLEAMVKKYAKIYKS